MSWGVSVASLLQLISSGEAQGVDGGAGRLLGELDGG